MSHIKSKALKFLAVFLALNILVETILPMQVFALTSGPKSPDFMSFTPVATTNMVDMLSGNFNYNLPVIDIPGAEGGGYSLSLAYNSGVNSEQEASWVGLGWSLNPGIIDRSMRGFPDDFDGVKVQHYNRTTPNWNISLSARGGMEIISKDMGVNVTPSVRLNNHTGYSRSVGLGLSVKGISMSTSYSLDDKDFTGFSVSVSMNKLLSNAILKASDKLVAIINEEIKKNGYTERSQQLINKMKLLEKRSAQVGSINTTTTFGLFTFSEVCRPTNFTSYSGFNASYKVTIQGNPSPAPIGWEAGLYGNFNSQYFKRHLESYAFGYMNEPKTLNTLEEYLNAPDKDKNPEMDYYVEKSSDFSTRDVFIGMPFSNADIFSVSGESMAGGFRAYRESIRNYFPSTFGSRENKIKNFNIGIQFHVGLSWGLGMDFGFGSQKVNLQNWGKSGNPSNEVKPYFRFNNDLGGKIEYGNIGSELIGAKVYSTVDIPGLRGATLQMDESKIFNNANINSKEASSSSYISYKTFKEVDGIAANSFTRTLNSATQNYSSLGLTDKSIAEFSIYNQAGDSYVYGVPVLTRNETRLSFDAPERSVENNYIAYRRTPLTLTDYNLNVDDVSITSAVGEVTRTPYATSFLLSQITNANYVDVKDDGPTDDDFGGWTKFSYRQAYGGNGSWYRYRTPYQGLAFSRGSLSDSRDDLGTVSTGEKEVYYLETVETKTHIAFFVTNKYQHDKVKYPEYAVPDGTLESRYDGLDAFTPTVEKPSVNEDLASRDKSAKGNKELQYLQKIVLFSKAQPNKPIKTVCFGYSQKLTPGIPNNSSINQQNKGKLTLERVWFEYNGTKPARISPYEFSYLYKKSDSFKSNIETYKPFFEEYDRIPEASQNPAYSPWALDAWGNIMQYGKERKKFDIPWIYQGNDAKYNPSNEPNWRTEVKNETTFDPAAWHLKGIKLPSGGEIVVQYEQKDYSYVQNRKTMGLASLIGSKFDLSKFEYYIDINVDDLGYSAKDFETKEDRDARIKEIEDYFSSAPTDDNNGTNLFRKKLYFKFLYNFMGEKPALTQNTSEYITGYSEVNRVTVEPLTGNTSIPYTIRLYLGSANSSSGERTDIPPAGAMDFYTHQRNTILNGNMKTRILEIDKQVEGRDSDEGLISFLRNLIDANAALVQNILPEKTKLVLSNSLSFVKLPIFKNKRGGGVRVKRLMIYDSGLESDNGDAQLLGQQYHYVLDDGVTSSGVATNEPSLAREENPLVQYMVRRGQSKWSRFSVGEDKEQNEGPFGESILPSAGVYYSRVVVENIHSSKVNTGFTVHEFNTTKDYPFDMDYSFSKTKDYNNVDKESDFKGSGVELTKLGDNTVIDKIPEINLLVYSYRMEKSWAAQGFRFIQNAMNGTQKQVTSYGGKYIKPTTKDAKDTDGGYLVTLQKYDYYNPGEKVSVLKRNGNGELEIVQDIPGKEEEIAVEKKQIATDFFDFDIEFDFSCGWALIPLPFVGITPMFSQGDELTAIHSTTRVIHYPAILKSETTLTDGIYHKNEYQVFSSTTGEPLITKTYDGYYDKNSMGLTGKPGEIYSFSIPASILYPEMGQKSISLSNTNQLGTKAVSITTYGAKPKVEWIDNSNSIPNVIQASVTNFSKDWQTSWNDPSIKAQYGIDNNPALIDKLQKIWRPKATFVYKDQQNLVGEALPSNSSKGGYYTISDNLNWLSPSNKWLKLSEVTRYSPDGNPIEEVDVMNTPSAVLYGKNYKNLLPIMVASNAKYSDIYFNDFEYTGSEISNRISHSGSCSKMVANLESLTDDFVISENLAIKGGILKLWISEGWRISNIFSIYVNSTKLNLKRIAMNGSWGLYECIVTKEILNPLVGNLLSVQLDGIPSGSVAYVDDVRLQPTDAQSTCFVYDNLSNKLLAQFDDQHFASFYRYNDEGVLTHKQVETESGVKTLQESQYNIPKVLRKQW